jgi:hypothetical protein
VFSLAAHLSMRRAAADVSNIAAILLDKIVINTKTGDKGDDADWVRAFDAIRAGGYAVYY